MPVNVLVVDDSGFFRRRLVEIFDADPRLKVIGTATNGQEAVDKVQSLKPDVVTMDYEMPVLDGIAAVASIMKSRPTPVLMFSSLTHEGARVTLDALEAGAVDFMPKNFEDISRDSAVVKKTLIERVLAVARTRFMGQTKIAAPAKAKKETPKKTGISRTPTKPDSQTKKVEEIKNEFMTPAAKAEIGSKISRIKNDQDKARILSAFKQQFKISATQISPQHITLATHGQFLDHAIGNVELLPR